MSNEFIIKSLNETSNIAKQLTSNLKNNIVFLIGDIGSGKTTFTKYFVQACGLYEEVYSPTFSIENRYKTKHGLIIHFDLYRIQNIVELDMIGFYDTLRENATIFIEWADKFDIEKYVRNYRIISFKILDNSSRIITIK